MNDGPDRSPPESSPAIAGAHLAPRGQALPPVGRAPTPRAAQDRARRSGCRRRRSTRRLQTREGVSTRSSAMAPACGRVHPRRHGYRPASSASCAGSAGPGRTATTRLSRRGPSCREPRRAPRPRWTRTSAGAAATPSSHPSSRAPQRPASIGANTHRSRPHDRSAAGQGPKRWRHVIQRAWPESRGRRVVMKSSIAASRESTWCRSCTSDRLIMPRRAR